MNYVQGFNLYDKWLNNLRGGRFIASYFHDNLYRSVAIYGMGVIGIQVYEELCKDRIFVSYGIDRNAEKIEVNGLSVVKPDSIIDMEIVDVIVITPFYNYAEIELSLIPLVDPNTDIVSIEHIVEYVKIFGEIKI